MAISEIDEITSKVLKYLENQHPDSTNLKVVTAGIRHEQDWWYVPVQPDKQPSRRFEYYELMLRRHRGNQIPWLEFLQLTKGGLQSRHIQLTLEREMTALGLDLQSLQLDKRA